MRKSGWMEIHWGLDCLELMELVAHKGGSGGGGGSQGSGKIEYPGYISDAHEDLIRGGQDADKRTPKILGLNLWAALNDLWDASPLAQVVAYDPTSDLDEIEARYADFDAIVAAIEPVTDRATANAAAVAEAGAVLSDAAVADVVTAFEARQRGPLMKSIGRLSAIMAGAGAAGSSAFFSALAGLESDHLQQVADFQKNLVFENYRMRVAYIAQATADITRLMLARIEADRASVTIRADINRMRIVAQNEYVNAESDITVEDALWNIKILQHGSNMLASPSGGVMSAGAGQRDPASGGKLAMIGPMISGAASGAAIGSAFPGIGTAVGALAGGVLGGMSAS